MNGRSILVLSLLLSLSACERMFFPDPIEDNKYGNFDLLWRTIDEKYGLFDVKDVDWQTVYDTCRPKLASIRSEVALFDLMASMLDLLRDGHTNLISGFDIGRNWNWYLSRPPNFNRELVERNYLGTGHRITGPFAHNWLRDSVGYVYYSSFSGNFSTPQLDLILYNYREAKGLILDVRDNGGGFLGNARSIAGHFSDQERVAFFEQAKSGPKANDFTGPQAVTVEPEGIQYKGNVVVLTNRSCYSATNSFAAMLQDLPQVTLMGDTTGGGGGLPIYGELPNGWTFRYSATRTFTPDGHSLEVGIPPDIAMDLDSAQLLQGKDSYIEAAIDHLQ